MYNEKSQENLKIHAVNLSGVVKKKTLVEKNKWEKL